MTASPELRVLRRPAATFRELASAPPSEPPSLFKRPLLFLLLMGATVSLLASGRVGARLVLDGMIASAFVPVFMILAMAVVYRRRPRTVTFARAVDVFFVANAPWVIWLLVVNVWRVLLTPAQASMMPFMWYYLMPLSTLPVAVWSTYIDRQFFRECLGADGARRDLILQRVISWGCIFMWFAGHELWEPIAIWIRF